MTAARSLGRAEDVRRALVESIHEWVAADVCDAALPFDAEKRARELERLGFWRVTVLSDANDNLDGLLLHADGRTAAEVMWIEQTAETVVDLTTLLAAGTSRAILSTGTRGGIDAWPGSLRQVFPNAEPADLADYHFMALDFLAAHDLTPVELDPESVLEYRKWALRMDATAIERLPREQLAVFVERLRRGEEANVRPISENPSTPAKLRFIAELLSDGGSGENG